MCNGQWRLMPHQDEYGRADRTPCCWGNTVPLHGKSQPRLPIGLLCDASGIAPDAMGWHSLTQAVPPAYAAFIFAQHVSAWLTRHRGMPVTSLERKSALPALGEWAAARGLRSGFDELAASHFNDSAAQPSYVRAKSPVYSSLLDTLHCAAHSEHVLGAKGALTPRRPLASPASHSFDLPEELTG